MLRKKGQSSLEPRGANAFSRTHHVASILSSLTRHRYGSLRFDTCEPRFQITAQRLRIQKIAIGDIETRFSESGAVVIQPGTVASTSACAPDFV